MRSVFAALAIGLLWAGQANASSFVVAESPSTIPPTPEVAAAPQEAVDSNKSPSFITLGEPEAEPAPGSVDDTATASVDGQADIANGEQLDKLTVWAQNAADAEWAEVRAVRSASMLYFGTPRADLKKARQRIASINPFQSPTVMRGGMFGGISAGSEDIVEDTAKEDAAPADGVTTDEASKDPATETKDGEQAQASGEDPAVPATPEANEPK